MDADRFETLLRALSSMPSRRTAVGVLAAAVGGAFASRLGSGNRDEAAAKVKHQEHRGQAQGKKKPCPPCKKRKKGKCKGLLPDGSACAGGSCRAGSCLPTVLPPPGCTPACGACQTCLGGSCVPQPLHTPCAGGLCQDGACAPCGAGQPCCAGDVCGDGLACTINNSCGSCGGPLEDCCLGGICDQGMFCASATCHPCGGEGEECCAGGTCDGDLVCVGFPEMCAHCGLENEACCPGGACTGFLVCCADVIEICRSAC
jgi:hypothetical protein